MFVRDDSELTGVRERRAVVDGADEQPEMAGEPEVVVSEVSDDLAPGALEAFVVGPDLVLGRRFEVDPFDSVVVDFLDDLFGLVGATNRRSRGFRSRCTSDQGRCRSKTAAPSPSCRSE